MSKAKAIVPKNSQMQKRQDRAMVALEIARSLRRNLRYTCLQCLKEVSPVKHNCPYCGVKPGEVDNV